MKKFITLLLAVVMVLTLSITAFAATGAFIQSPGKINPSIIGYETDIPNYDGKIVIVPYTQKETLPIEETTLMDNAYNEISGKTKTTNLKDLIQVISRNSNVASDKLGVVDLFDIHEEGATAVTDDGKYKFSISLAGVKNYKSLIYMDSDGVWHEVADAQVSEDGMTLTFTTTTLSAPYALVIEKTGMAVATDTSEKTDDSKKADSSSSTDADETAASSDDSQSTGRSPKTGDNSLLYVYTSLAGLSAMIVLVASKKKVFGIK